MAINAKFQSKSDVEVYIGTEITMGTATLYNTSGAFKLLPVVDYSISDIQAPLGVAPQRAGSFGQQESGARHDRTQQMFEISLTMHGTAGVIDRMCLALFGDGDGDNDLLGSMPTVTKYEHDQANIVPVTLLFKNGGTNNNDLHYLSAMCTSLEMSYGLGADGGALSCTATFVTGYLPVQSTFGTLTSPTTGAGVVLNINDMDIQSLGGQDILINDFSLNISRSVTRISYQASTFAPYGYSIGMYEVTGTIGCKRDANSNTIATNTGAGIALNVGKASTFEVTCPDVMIESLGTETADEGWKHSFGYRAFYADASDTASIVKIETA